MFARIQFPENIRFTGSRTSLVLCRDPRRMPCICLLGRRDRKADGSAIGRTGRFTVERLGNGKRAGRRHVEDTAFVVDEPRRDAQSAQRRIVKLLGFLNVVGTNHDVAEHMHPLCHFERLATNRAHWLV